eukprot:gene10393-13959_t
MSASSNHEFVTKIQSKYDKISTFLIFFFPALGGLLFGYDIGATSAVVSQLQSSTYSGVSWSSAVSNSSLLQGVITSIGMFGAMLGSMTCFKVADDLGRRRSLILASTLFLIGSIIESSSGSYKSTASTGIFVLILGRMVYGYACGFAMHGAPAYIGEMSPPQIRGVLVSMKEAFIVLGMVLGYSIGYMNSTTVGGWRATYGFSSIFAIFMFFGMIYLPPSARWLALKQRVNEARSSMSFVIPDMSEEEIASLRNIASKAKEYSNDTSLAADWKKFNGPTIFPAMVAGVGLVILQQITGQPSVLYYADSIFQDVGLSSLASIGISVFKLIATLLTTFTVDNFGRKLLLHFGCSLMLFALIILTIAFMFKYTSKDECNSYTTMDSCPGVCLWEKSCEVDCTSSGFSTTDDCTCCGINGINFQKSIILLSLFIYIGGYQVGFGPISWLIISEIFPLEVRGKAVSIAVVTNFFWNTIMTFLFPIELDLIGSSLTFFLYAIILAYGIYFIHYNVPETKGLTLEQIENFFLLKSAKIQTEDQSEYKKSSKSSTPLPSGVLSDVSYQNQTVAPTMPYLDDDYESNDHITEQTSLLATHKEIL